MAAIFGAVDLLVVTIKTPQQGVLDVVESLMMTASQARA
jgi:hypothetical protein